MPIRNKLQLIRDLIFFKLCGARKIIGLNFSRNFQQRLYDPKTCLWEHESHRLARLISCENIIDFSSRASWDLCLSKEERGMALQCLGTFFNQPFIALSIGTKVPAKDWGLNNWIDLIKKIDVLYGNFSLVFIGSADEYEYSELVAHHWSGKTLNFCGKIQPRISAAVIEKAVLFLGHDSGPMHLAASVGVPIVAIFSARNKPGEWYPFGVNHKVLYNMTNCYGCELDVCMIEKLRCMRGISVDRVLNQVVSILGAQLSQCDDLNGGAPSAG